MKSNLMKVALTSIGILCATVLSFGQGKIAGKVIDKTTGEVLIGANVTVVGANAGSASDLDGNFFVSVPAGTYKVITEYVGYATTETEGVVVKDKETTHMDIVVSEAAEELQEVVVKAEVKQRATVEALLVQQKNAVANVSGITADQFRKLPDRTTGDILKRVSGASIQDNKFAVIRGLTDRYNMAMVNGVPMPSTESDRKAFSFDLIPAALLDNMVIVKTATPDMQGDFAGGIIQINTKDIPDENVQTLSVGLAANTITTFQSSLRESPSTGNFLGLNKNGGFPSSAPGQDNYKDLSRAEVFSNTKHFNNNFTPKYINSTRPNLSLQYTLGRRFDVAKNPLGVLFALNYNNSFRNTSGEINIFSAPGGAPDGLFYDKNTINRNQTLAGGILNLTYRIGQDTKLSFKNLYNISSEGFVSSRSGQLIGASIEDNKKYTDTAFYFTTSRMYSSQLGAEHVFKNKIKLKSIVGANFINRDVPTYRKMSTLSGYDSENSVFYAPSVDVPFQPSLFSASAGQYFSTMKEKSVNWTLDVTIPVKIIRTDFKVGSFLQSRSRNFEYIALSYQNPSRAYFNDKYSTTTFTDKNFDKGNVGLFFSANSKYEASSKLSAVYAMADTRFNEKFRLIYGARYEYFKQEVITHKLDTNKLDNGDVLPSATFIYSITPKMNFKLTAAKTLCRPEFREVSAVQFYDFNYASNVEGNPKLKRAQIYNYDVKYEFYPSSGEIFSISPFYKKFIDPVETVIDAANAVRVYNYVNQKSAICYGFEIEARKKFLKDFVVFMNYAYIKSQVNTENNDEEKANHNRPLQGQSPYVVNAGLQYNNDKYMFNSSLSINRVGDRIMFQNAIAKQMIWEKGRTVLDFQFSKTFFKKLECRYIFGDILAKGSDLFNIRNQQQILYNDMNNNKHFDQGKDIVMYSYSMGSTHSFTLSYKF